MAGKTLRRALRGKITLPMNRRHFLRNAILSLPAVEFMASRASAADPKTSALLYNAKPFIEWAKADLEKRAALVQSVAGIAVPLNFRYLHGKLSAKDESTRKELWSGRFSHQATARHIDALLADIEAVRKEVAAKEVEAAAVWAAKNKEEKPEGAQVSEPMHGKIFGSDVSARNLGVILDSSGSMSRFVAKLRAEIHRDFAGCNIVEVPSCTVSGNADAAWFYASPVSGINPFTPDRHCPAISSELIAQIRHARSDTASAIVAMVTLMKNDAIYWFSDFKDGVSDKTVAKIAVPVLANKVKLYLHTIDKPPAKSLADLVEKSGGMIIKKTVR